MFNALANHFTAHPFTNRADKTPVLPQLASPESALDLGEFTKHARALGLLSRVTT